LAAIRLRGPLTYSFSSISRAGTLACLVLGQPAYFAGVSPASVNGRKNRFAKQKTGWDFQ